MKNLLSTLMMFSSALLFGANSRSLLEMKFNPLEGLNELPQKTITISIDGFVLGQLCDNRDTCRNEVLGSLSRSDVNFLRSEIARTSEHALEPIEYGNYCLTIPVGHFRYTALDNTVVLKEGISPCGNGKIVDHPSTRNLIVFLNGWADKLEARTWFDG